VVVLVGSHDELPAIVRHAFAIYFVIMAIAIAVGGLIGDRDLTFGLAGVAGVVLVLWGFYVVTNRRQARDAIAERNRARTMKLYPGPTLAGGISAIAVGTLFIGFAIVAVVGQVP
jgi:uncharacterized membrane protein YfcA